MKVLLVEDDYIQEDMITETLERTFTGIKVEKIRTEAEFYDGIDRIASKPPDVVVMDVMLRWTDPAPNMPTPPDKVQQEGYPRAGLRCADMLAKRDETKNIPVILFTVLNREDLELPKTNNSILYVSKESDLDELINRVRSASDTPRQRR